MKRQKDMTPEGEPPRSVGVQYATGEGQKNSSRRIKRHSQSRNGTQLWMSGGKSEVRCCKEQYYITTWNVRSTNQGKFSAVKQEMERMNTDILGVSELKWE